MKKHNLKVLLTIFALFSVISCEKLEYDHVLIVAIGTEKPNVQNVGGILVSLPGEILDIGKEKIIDHGHCYDARPNPTYKNMRTSLGPREGIGKFSSHINSFSKTSNDTIFYARAYAISSRDTVYSKDVAFEIIRERSLLDTWINNLKTSSVSAGGKVEEELYNASKPIIQHGHCWSTNPTPTINGNKTTLGILNQAGVFTSDLTGLTAGVTYYIRSYITTNTGTIYGHELNF